eukprot:7560530-Pyramimonas_sp.AAC.1
MEGGASGHLQLDQRGRPPPLRTSEEIRQLLPDASPPAGPELARRALGCLQAAPGSKHKCSMSRPIEATLVEH